MLTFSDPGFTKSAWSPQPSQTTQGNIPLQIPAHLSAPPSPLQVVAQMLSPLTPNNLKSKI